jgi:hypothetical protein
MMFASCFHCDFTRGRWLFRANIDFLQQKKPPLFHGSRTIIAFAVDFTLCDPVFRPVCFLHEFHIELCLSMTCAGQLILSLA